MRGVARDVLREAAVWALLAAGAWGLAAGLRAANRARAVARARAATDPLEQAFQADRWRVHAAARAVLEEDR